MEIPAWIPSGHSAKRKDRAHHLTRLMTHYSLVMILPARSKKVRMRIVRRPWLVNGMALTISPRTFNGRPLSTFLEVASRYPPPQKCSWFSLTLGNPPDS